MPGSLRLRDAAEGLSWHDFREENGAVHVAVAGAVAIIAVAAVVAVGVAAVAADADAGADAVGDDVVGAADDDAVDGLGGADESDALDALAAAVVGAVDAVDVVLASPVLCHIPFVSCLAVFAADLAQCLFLADLSHARYLLLSVVIAGAGSSGLTVAAHN